MPARWTSVVTLALTLSACGRPAEAPFDGARSDGGTAYLDSCTAPGSEASCNEPPGSACVTLIGYLVSDCAWQAYPRADKLGAPACGMLAPPAGPVWLDTFLSDERPSGTIPAACGAPPITSSTLIHAAICRGLSPCQSMISSDTPYRIEGYYTSAEICTPTTMGGPLSCAAGKLFVPTRVTVATVPPVPLARYYYTTETSYDELSLSGDELFYATFEDKAGACGKWIAQSPCWSTSDLVIYRASLAPGEVQAIRAAIKGSGFFSLGSPLGGASKDQRHYPVVLSARDDGASTSHEVVYQSFPAADPMPEAFVDAFRALSGALCKRLGKQAGGPFPPSARSCP